MPLQRPEGPGKYRTLQLAAATIADTVTVVRLEVTVFVGQAAIGCTWSGSGVPSPFLLSESVLLRNQTGWLCQAVTWDWTGLESWQRHRGVAYDSTGTGSASSFQTEPPSL